MEQLLEVLVSSEVSGEFLPWFLDIFKNPESTCSIEEFAIFFLNFIRNQTDGFLKGNLSSSACNTPRKLPAGDCQNDDFGSDNLKSQQQHQPHNSSSLTSVSRAVAVDESANFPNVAVTPNLLPSGNDHATGNNCNNNSSMELLDNSLQLRSTTPASQKGTTTISGYFRKSLSRTFESIHDVSASSSQTSFVDSSPLKALESRLYRSDTSTPVRKTNRNGGSDVNTMGSNCFGSANKTRSTEKSNSKKSPGTVLCLGDFMLTPTTTSARQKRKSNKDHLGSAENRSASEPAGKQLFAQKPKRRVVPTRVSATTNSFTSPAFRSENNILRIAKDEESLDNSPVVLQERQALKKQMNAIAKEFTNELLPLPQTLHMIIQEKHVEPTKRKISKVRHLNLSELQYKSLLDRLVLIHAALIDSSLVNNILNELAFAINLINIEDESRPSPPKESDIASIGPSDSVATPVIADSDNQIDPELINQTATIASDTIDIYTLFRNIDNCTYYGLELLRQQKLNLILLDVTTLKVILDNEHLEAYDKPFRDYLDVVCSHKIRLESIKSNHEVAFRIRQDFNNVFYQPENDTRNNFPSEKEFTAFKQQRDMFYGILKTWECKHLDPSWKFSQALGPKVYSLLTFQENPINMAHLARLYISQLIISSNFTHSPTDLEFSLGNVDLNKLTKLKQRLIQPSFFSTDYQFPGNQAFFRDFLLACRKSLLFIEQLKIALAAQLIDMNDSSYEILNLSSKDSHGREYNEYVVRPETLSTMRILSKFLGLVETLPFTYDGSHNALVDNRQIELRNMIHPTFDLMSILRKSITERKLIITIPWIVQYVSMLDYITLRLAYYRRVLQLLYELYMNLTTDVQYSIELLQMRPTSIFIIRTSLGWLFDNPMLPEDYYKYRQNRRFLFDFTNCDIKEMDASLHLAWVEPHRHRTTAAVVSASTPKTTTDKAAPAASIASKPATIEPGIAVVASVHPNRLSDEIPECPVVFDPLLENILNVACPFLADFRVSIMPTKFSKTVSRTGRYRHITTKLYEPQLRHESESNDAQTKLSEAFLHSQSLSVRKIVEFVIERTTSAVIKDFQIEILIPSKADAMSEIGKIESIELKHVSKEMRDIFATAHQKAMQVWDEKIPGMIEIRVKKALDALLPIETLEAVKNTCVALVIQKCQTKTSDWRQSNLKHLDFYSKDITADAEKIVKTNTAAKQPLSTVLKIDIDRPNPSKLFDRLQLILHFSRFERAHISADEIIEYCRELRSCLMEQKLPTSINRLAGTMTVNLVQNLIQCRCDIVDDKLIDSFIDVWTCDTLCEFVDIKLLDRDDDDARKLDYIFNSLLPKFYIELLGNNSKSFDNLTILLIRLVKANLVTVDYLNKRFVALLKIEWTDDVTQLLSKMCDKIAGQISSNTDQKSQLFLEMLADLTRDLDKF